MEATPYYLDTSLYLGMLLGEPSATVPFKKSSGRPLCSSVLLLIETERNLVRMAREGVLKSSDYEIAMGLFKNHKANFLLRDLTVDLCLTGSYPALRVPKSADLIHLRTALWFQKNGGLTGFLTLDEAQRIAAEELGLPT